MKINYGKWYTCVYALPSLIVYIEGYHFCLNISFLAYWVEFSFELKE